jgi:accessory gene regulator B
MIGKISVFLSEGIGSRLNSSDNEKEVYAYSIEVLLSLLINLLILSSVAYIFNKVLELLIFIIFLSGLRVYAGGYHSRTHAECFVVSLSAFVITVVCGIYLSQYGEVILVFGVIFSIFMVFRLAPADTENKPLSKNERKKYKIISRVIVLALSLAAVVLYFTRAKTGHIYINAVLAMVIESVSLLKK